MQIAGDDRDSQDIETFLLAGTALPTKYQVFISYHSQGLDRALAEELSQALQEAGHQVFRVEVNLQLGATWSQQIETKLKQCDYYLLLLSEQSATSEMVTEEVRRVKERQESRTDGKPIVLPIRVAFPINTPLNYKLRGYLAQLQQREWRDRTDTPVLIAELLKLLATHKDNSNSGETLTPSLIAPSFDLPLPAAEPELPDGLVELASAFYIERRPIEVQVCEEIKKPGALIRIKGPKQMGKTSLMARILHHSDQQGYKTVPLSFELADGKIFTDLDKFLRWFCAAVGRRLQLPNRLDDYWDDIFGSNFNCTAYFEEYLLAQIDSPLVLGLDEVHRVFDYPDIATDFLALLRVWHEEAKNREIWKKLRLIVVHTTEVYVKIPVSQSPFNVGLPIELSDFSPEQIQDLAQRHGLHWTTGQIEELMQIVGGHPYLVRLALYQVAKQKMTWEQLLQTAATEAGPYRDHLRRNLWILQQHPELANSFCQVVMNPEPVRLESTMAFQLQSMGLVHLEGNEVRVRYDLYRQYFTDFCQKFLENCRVNYQSHIKTPDEHQPVGSILAAVAFTDVVNSTPLMVADQNHMMELLKRDFRLMRELCQRYEGQVIKSMGDGLLLYFTSAVKAVSCAQKIQKSFANAASSLPATDTLKHRIGIHLGEVWFSGDDVLGVGVNIASRLQGKAQPGGICISQTVYEVVRNQLPLEIAYLGMQKLKGITEPVPLYHIQP